MANKFVSLAGCMALECTVKEDGTTTCKPYALEAEFAKAKTPQTMSTAFSSVEILVSL